MAFLEVDHLGKSFGNVQVLKQVSFSMEKGSVLALIGSSGGGKTTLLRCLNFLELADTGTIHLNGQEWYNAASDRVAFHRQQEGVLRGKTRPFGLVFQNYNLFPQYTALENVMLAPKLAKSASEEEIARRANELLRAVGLADKMNNYPHQLSGGQQQRTAIARALMMQPEVLCFDEPTSALDPELTAEVLQVIRRLKDKGYTMIIVTHEMSFVRAVADRVLFLADGSIAGEGAPEEVLDHPVSDKLKAFLAYEGGWKEP